MSDLEMRVAAIEARLGMQEALRASQDRDLSDVKDSTRAINHLVQALSITQSQHTATLSVHTEQLSRIEQRTTRIEHGVQAILELLTRARRQRVESCLSGIAFAAQVAVKS